MSAADDEEIRAALRRNDRYLTAFIEALAICPYARSCRETGRLYREVLLHDEPDAEQLSAHIQKLETIAPAEIEVGLLIMPRIKLPPVEFERFVSQVQRIYQKSRTQSVAFFVVAFHPHLNAQLHNHNVAVRFMRRSPDPTIQLVRPEAIERVRGDRSADLVSRNIAESGWKTVLEYGSDKLSTMLNEIAASYRP